MRQGGAENERLVELLGRLRDGTCNSNDYNALAGRILRRQNDAEVLIVTNNASRDAVNWKAAQAFAIHAGVELHWYHAMDAHKKAPVTDASLIEKSEQQHSGQTKHRLRKTPLAIGMPVAINQNFDVAAGVVNGSYGTLRKIRYFRNNAGLRVVKSCVAEIPGAEVVEIPHLPKHNFPVLPDTTELRFEHAGSHKRCTIQRKQVPIESGFAVTVHKAQGQTMTRVVVNLEGCSGTEPPYVMVSRATSMEGLFVLRDLDFKQISKRRSEDLRTEFSRLACLKWLTVMKYGERDEIERAKQVVEHPSSHKPSKRKQDDQRSALAEKKVKRKK